MFDGFGVPQKNAEVGHEIDDFFAFFGALLCQGLWTTPLGDGRPKTRGEGGWGMEMIPIDSRENRGSIMRRYGNSSINAGFLREKKWRHSGCSPAMLDYWYFGGS